MKPFVVGDIAELHKRMDEDFASLAHQFNLPLPIGDELASMSELELIRYVRYLRDPQKANAAIEFYKKTAAEFDVDEVAWLIRGQGVGEILDGAGDIALPGYGDIRDILEGNPGGVVASELIKRGVDELVPGVGKDVGLLERAKSIADGVDKVKGGVEGVFNAENAAEALDDHLQRKIRYLENRNAIISNEHQRIGEVLSARGLSLEKLKGIAYSDVDLTAAFDSLSAIDFSESLQRLRESLRRLRTNTGQAALP